jgi:hypothetical protein
VAWVPLGYHAVKARGEIVDVLVRLRTNALLAESNDPVPEWL